jgi:hypothetical protein
LLGLGSKEIQDFKAVKKWKKSCRKCCKNMRIKCKKVCATTGFIRFVLSSYGLEKNFKCVFEVFIFKTQKSDTVLCQWFLGQRLAVLWILNFLSDPVVDL